MLMNCPSCGRVLDITGIDLSASVACPACSHAFIIPTPVDASPPLRPIVAPVAQPVSDRGHVVKQKYSPMCLVAVGSGAMAMMNPLAGIAAIAIGILGLRECRENGAYKPESRALAWVGIVVGALGTMFFAAYMAIFVHFARTGFGEIMRAASESAAISAGQSAVRAQKTFYDAQPPDKARYSSDLEELMIEDDTLAPSSDVTFVFGAANQSGFTFTTRISDSEKTHVWDEKSRIPPKRDCAR